MNKYVRVMDGLKSNAGKFDYKLNKINTAKIWNPNSIDPEEMGGFNFSSEDKILRWLHRGDTIYDVIVPDDAELIQVDKEKGIYRSNKIIVTNPRIITDDMVIDLYKKTTLSDKIIAQCLQTLLWKDRLEISKYIIKDRVNKDIINVIINEFENYNKKNNKFNYNELGEKSKIIYDILKEIQSPLDISLYIDKDPYIKELSSDKVINVTGESGSGKSYYVNKYLNSNDYIIIDTDIVFSNKPSNNKESVELRKVFNNKSKEYVITNFDDFYLKTLEYFKDSNKPLVIDSAQYRNILEYSILKGQVIIIRTSINNCYERAINRWKSIMNNNYTEEEYKKYVDKKKGVFKWYKSLNKFIEKVDKLPTKNNNRK